jgi:hypothetical protein
MAPRKNSRTSKTRSFKAPTESHDERIRRVADDIYSASEHTDDMIRGLSDADLRCVHFKLRINFDAGLGNTVFNNSVKIGNDTFTVKMKVSENRILNRLYHVLNVFRSEADEREICICTSPNCKGAAGTVN